MTAFNRTLWTVIGAALALLGVAGLLAHFGVLPGVDPTDVLAPPRAPGVTQRPAPWPAVLGVGVGVVLLLLGVALLWAQRPRRPGHGPALALPGAEPDPRAWADPGPGADGGGRGRTRVDPAVLDRAVRRDLRRDHRLHHVRAHIVWVDDQANQGPRVGLRVQTGPDEDLNPVRDEVREAVRRLGDTMSVRPKLTRVEIGSARIPGRTSL